MFSKNISYQNFKKKKVIPKKLKFFYKNLIERRNSENNLIKSLNEGVLDTSFRINWQDYRNCILLTNGGDFKRLNTKIHKIINL